MLGAPSVFIGGTIKLEGTEMIRDHAKVKTRSRFATVFNAARIIWVITQRSSMTQITAARCPYKPTAAWETSSATDYGCDLLATVTK